MDECVGFNILSKFFDAVFDKWNINFKNDFINTIFKDELFLIFSQNIIND